MASQAPSLRESARYMPIKTIPAKKFKEKKPLTVLT